MLDRILSWRVSVTVLLFVGLLLFSGATIWVAIRLPEDDKVYAFLTGIAGNFGGGLFTWLQIKARSAGGSDDERQ